MTERIEIRLAGAGGQGLILAGLILAEAAALHDGKYVCQTQSYGPEARGGACKSEVVISDQDIDYPKVIKPDVLLCLNQPSCETYGLDLKPGGTLIVDATFVHEVPPWAVALPFTKIAREQVGREVTANIVALGALALLTEAVSLQALKAAVRARIPPGTEELNRKALKAGITAAKLCLQEKAGRVV